MCATDGSKGRCEHAEQHAASACGALARACGKPAEPPAVPVGVNMPPVLAAAAPQGRADPLAAVKEEVAQAALALAPRYTAALQPIVEPGASPPPVIMHVYHSLKKLDFGCDHPYIPFLLSAFSEGKGTGHIRQ